MQQKNLFVLLTFLILQICGQVFGQSAENPSLIVQTGHSEDISTIVFSPNDRLFASTSYDKKIILWEVISGKELRVIEGISTPALTLAFSPDSKILAGGFGDGTTVFWDIATGEKIYQLKSGFSPIGTLTFSKDGKYTATWDEFGNVKMWDITKRKQLETDNFVGYPISSIIIGKNKNLLFIGSRGGGVIVWDFINGKEIYNLKKETPEVNTLAINSEETLIASGGLDNTVRIWSVQSGKLLNSFKGHTAVITQVSFSIDEKNLISADEDGNIKHWDIGSSKLLNTFKSRFDSPYYFNATGDILAAARKDGISLWNVLTKKQIRSINWSNLKRIDSVAFNLDEEELLYRRNNSIKFWSLVTGASYKTLILNNDTSSFFDNPERKVFDNTDILPSEFQLSAFSYLKNINFEPVSPISFPTAFNPDKSLVAAADIDQENRQTASINLFEFASGKKLYTLVGHKSLIANLAFSKDGKILASGDNDLTVKLWDVNSGKELKTFKRKEPSNSSLFNNFICQPSLGFSPDSQVIAIGDCENTITLREVISGEILKVFKGHTSNISTLGFSSDGTLLISGSDDATVKIWSVKEGTLLATLIEVGENNWIVVTPDNRFDTNKLEQPEGLHWIIQDTPFTPLPLEIFSRSYFEPKLLPRILKCTEENNCDKEFKPLPSIAEINRVQPKVSIKEINPSANSTDLADVTIEVENVTDEVSLSATDKTKKKQLSSGIYDLRLFRDGQLVGVSTPKDKFAQFIADAPRLVAENKASGKLIDTPEDKAWREANDIFKIKAENVKQVSPNKIEYTFRNIKLPRDGRKQVEFTAYAFNSDKVKSTITEPFKFTIPTAVANNPIKGRAVVVSIGVNASENPAYNLRYAANDARKMQEIVGTRLKKNLDKYSEVIQIPLISDYGTDGKIIENIAQKAIIKGVFSLLSGNGNEVSPEILRQIPNREKIKPIEPEDTLLIAYSGHGYTDQSGIFYLLPYDIGKETSKLTPEVLQKTISSDELSLWMQDITAAEMIMVIDACHSSAAVQGDGFKPGPMGSRGLGQLAYDKDMKILSATQADNVALELGSLQQGLLSYALLEDGIVKGQADADKNKQLFSNEWLTFAEKRVPELYQEVRNGKRSVIIDGKLVKAKDTIIIDLNGKRKSNLNLQQPSLFDFKRRKTNGTLLSLP